ncbi:MAG: hypothetical protein GTO41_07705, partial [Burkholderiales bacterium]|nr:hypothetical protein [Burkholderiales bacterium]
MLRWLGALLVALFMVGSACADDEFLDPEQAFQFSARLKSNGTLEVHYLIAEGYYMYRDRFRFDVRPASIVLGAPRFPPGQWHEDEFFGVSQIFRGSVTIEIPI